MRLKERIISYRQKVQGCNGIQKFRQSAPIRQLGWIVTVCRAHPFLIRALLILSYRLLLDVLYLTVLSPLFAYSGFTTFMRPLTYICSLLAVLAFTLPVSRMNEDISASSIICTFLNYLYFIPLTSYFGCKGTMEVWIFFVALLYWSLILFWQFRLPILYLRPLDIRHSHVIMIIIIAAACLLVMFVSGRYTGFRFTLDFWNVYDIRAEAAGYRIPTLLSYLLSMMKIILPVGLLYWLKRKRYWVVFAICIIYIFFFSITALKSVFFFLFLVLAGYFFYREWMLQWMPGLLSLLTFVSILERKVIGSFHIVDLFVRRMMYVPVQLAEEYAVFFQENPIDLFRDSIMGKLSFQSIYSSDIARLLGEYEGYPELNANNGLLGDMFANLPIPLGLLLMPLILVICFRLLDMVSRSLETKLLIPFCVFFASTFMNASWSTTLLSHGFLIACLMLYFFPKKEGILK